MTTYLEIRKGDFYSIESTVDGKRFATARGEFCLSDGFSMSTGKIMADRPRTQ